MDQSCASEGKDVSNSIGMVQKNPLLGCPAWEGLYGTTMEIRLWGLL